MYGQVSQRPLGSSSIPTNTRDLRHLLNARHSRGRGQGGGDREFQHGLSPASPRLQFAGGSSADVVPRSYWRGSSPICRGSGRARLLSALTTSDADEAGIVCLKPADPVSEGMLLAVDFFCLSRTHLGRSSRPHPRLSRDVTSDSDTDEMAPSLSYRSPLTEPPSPLAIDGSGEGSGTGSEVEDDGGDSSLLRGDLVGVEPAAAESPEVIIQDLLKSSSSDEASPVRNEELQSLLSAYHKLKMSFVVRCKFLICAFQGGALQDIWQNNITVRGVLLRRMQCLHCREM